MFLDSFHQKALQPKDALDPWPYAFRGTGSIVGEVYDISGCEDLIEQLDYLEGVDQGLYQRDIVTTDYGPAFIYIAHFERSAQAIAISEFLPNHQGNRSF